MKSKVLLTELLLIVFCSMHGAWSQNIIQTLSTVLVLQDNMDGAQNGSHKNMTFIDLTSYVSSSCPGKSGTPMFDCFKNQTFCVKLSQRMNCVNDCPNQLDEWCDLNQTKCDGCKCVPDNITALACLDYVPNGCNVSGNFRCPYTTICLAPTALLNGSCECANCEDEDFKIQNSCALDKVNCPSDQNCTFAPGIGSSCVNLISLAYVVDTTSSMAGVPPLVQTATKQFVSVMNSILGPTGVRFSEFIIVTFGNGTPQVALDVTVPSGLNGTLTASMRLLDGLEKVWITQGGNGCAERSLAALKLAVQTVRQNSIIYVFTDADASDTSMLTEVQQLIKLKQVQVNYIMSGYCGIYRNPGYIALQDVAKNSGGLLVQLAPQFTIATALLPFTQILTFFGQYSASSTVLIYALERQLNGSNGNYSITFPIDPTITAFDLVASGCNLSLAIRDSSGVWQNPNVSAGSFIVKRYLNVAVFAELLVDSPIAGYYVVQVSSICDSSVRVYAATPSTFDLLWTIDPSDPNAIALTSPWNGVHSYVQVVPTGAWISNTSFTQLDEVTPSGQYVQTSFFGFNSTVLAFGLVPNASITKDKIVPYYGNVYIKLSGYVLSTYKFQRYTNIPVLPNMPDIDLRQTSNCDDNSLQCSSLSRSSMQSLNCNPACPDGFDAACNSGYTKCGCQCVDAANYTYACANRKLQRVCNDKTTYKCANGECIPKSLVMDGVSDCVDNSDESIVIVDECALNGGGCSSQATCTKLAGDYIMCTCNKGLQGDGFTCWPAGSNPVTLKTRLSYVTLPATTTQPQPTRAPGQTTPVGISPAPLAAGGAAAGGFKAAVVAVNGTSTTITGSSALPNSVTASNGGNSVATGQTKTNVGSISTTATVVGSTTLSGAVTDTGATTTTGTAATVAASVNTSATIVTSSAAAPTTAAH